MAELAVTCPACGGSVNIPIEAEAKTYTCPHCGSDSPIQESLDAFGTAMKDPLIGAVVSECEIQEKVGEGGFGAVYKAFDKNLQRPVALKVMLQSLTSNLEFVQKFIREAVTAAQLNHPNIVAIHKVGRDEDRNLHFLIMEFLEGRTLSEVIEERGALPLDESISIILQCADALAVAQDKNIIHRDIKPENIMMDRNGVVKITDFGLAKTLTTDMKSTKVVGTPHYMSPEQFEGKAVDGRTDIYSLGITFYYMLTQAKPYEGTNTVQIIYSILTQDPKPASDINPDVPEEVWRIIRRMIAKEVTDRYSDFREVRRDLLSYQERSIAQKVTCPECNAVNVRGRKFCRECGSSLLVKCPGCGHEEPAGTRHCGECGTNIDEYQKISQNLDRGEKLRGFGDLKRALSFYQEVLKLDPEHPEAEKATREIRLELDRIEERKNKIDELVKQGEADRALEEVQGLLTEFPKVEDVSTYGQTVQRSLKLRAVDAHLLVAEKALEEGRLESAIDAYEAALGVDPDRAEIKEKLEGLRSQIAAFTQNLAAAKSALADGRHVDALRAAKELLRLKPGHAAAMEIHEEAKAKVESIETFVRDAQDLLESKQYDEAISRLETALEISPKDENVEALLLQARRGRAEIDEKLTLIRRLLAEDKPEEALRGAEELLADHPEHTVAAGLKAEAAASLEEREREQELDSLTARGRELEKEGELEAARDVYAEILDKDPENQRAENLKEKVEARLEEAENLRKLSEEQLADGAIAQAAVTLAQLRDMFPKDKEIRKKAELASAKRETIEGALARATDALRRKRFDLVLKAADEVLAIAPKNGEAIAAKKDAERGLAAIEKQLDEARELIDSELFDDALVALEKAKERGARDDEIEPVRKAAEDGKLMLLKSDATRSFVFKDFAAAIEKYEEILAASGDDPDAQKGIKAAEKAIRARGRETWIGKGIAAGALVVLMLVVQFAAVGSGSGGTVVVPADNGSTDVATGTGTATGTGSGTGTDVTPVELPKPPPDVTDFQALEKDVSATAEGWTAVREGYDKWLEEHPDEEDLADGRDFAVSLVTAFETPLSDHPARLAAFRAANDKVGRFPQIRRNREEVIRAAVEATIRDWIEQIGKTESEDYGAATEAYQRILEDPVVSELGLYDQVKSYKEFSEAMADADAGFRTGEDYPGVYGDFAYAAGLEGLDEARRRIALDRQEKVKQAWIANLRERWAGTLVNGAEVATGQQRWDFINEMTRMEAALGMTREEVYEAVVEGK